MARTTTPSVLLLMHLVMSFAALSAAASYNVVDYGAEPDGRRDAAGAFLAAWAAACGSGGPATMVVPEGRFLVSGAVFSGPCRGGAVAVSVAATILAPVPYSNLVQWIVFQHVDGLAISGGTLDGRGRALWDCRKAGGACPAATRALTIYRSNNVIISGLTSYNSPGIHITIRACTDVTLDNTVISAPGDSPNTDGIHIKQSSYVTITGAKIGTGDDCISMVEGSSNIWIEGINCGPGHGISIGSLGDTPEQLGVQNITVKSGALAGTQNGLRIKTWAKANSGIVNGVTFTNIVMSDVQNPIIIDQNYCPGGTDCPSEGSGIKISNISYTNIYGTSATQIAVKFDCSPSKPCSSIVMRNVKLTYQKQSARSFCRNAQGFSYGLVIPPSCL